MFKDTDKFELFWQQALRQGYCIFKGLIIRLFSSQYFLFELHTINFKWKTYVIALTNKQANFIKRCKINLVVKVLSNKTHFSFLLLLLDIT